MAIVQLVKARPTLLRLCVFTHERAGDRYKSQILGQNAQTQAAILWRSVKELQQQ